jgi:triosephosphate isomerase
MRIPVLGGNRKMYKDPAGTTSFFETFRPLVEPSTHCEIVSFATLVNLQSVKFSNVTRQESILAVWKHE